MVQCEMGYVRLQTNSEPEVPDPGAGVLHLLCLPSPLRNHIRQARIWVQPDLLWHDDEELARRGACAGEIERRPPRQKKCERQPKKKRYGGGMAAQSTYQGAC